MEKKQNELKVASKVIAVIMKIGYIAMIVAICICAASLIFLAATGGKMAIVTSGGTTIGISDIDATPAEVIGFCTEFLVISAFLLAIFYMAQKMFGEISVSGEPFKEKYVKIIRIIGILIVAMTVAVGIVDIVISSIESLEGLDTYTEAPGIVFGAIIFCLSYVVDYGCALKNKQEAKEAESRSVANEK